MTPAEAPLPTVPQASPKLRFDRYRTEIETAIAACFDNGAFVAGPLVERFETELAGFLGCDHVVSCNSCTDALAIGLQASGLGAGDQVIVPSLTAAGTATAVVQAGASPRFADVNRRSRNIDLPTVQAAMTRNVRAIVAVHLHGNPVDLDPILEFAQKHQIVVIEDCAQAIGAKYKGTPVGNFGKFGAFSFYPTKNLGGPGDGGALAAEDASLAERARSIANYGWNSERKTILAGQNSRLDALQAAILLTLLPHLTTGNAQRREAAKAYDQVLSRTEITPPDPQEGGVYHQYAVTTAAREKFVAQLATSGVQTGRHYPQGLHTEPFFQSFVDADQSFPNTDFLADRLVSLPIQPELMAHLPHILAAIRAYLDD